MWCGGILDEAAEEIFNVSHMPESRY
ncbi:hypothetical protein CBM2634_B160021 [Cupriavidus taiwanensis]|uniref:Uncharacterized protein n=1 Tax=Cupriavidus taiwanensis TaxID=164546 RepID=A0A375J4N5_9BURK|nr:hypothetical protein CBM2634_B160021 [Cupriavidus taiwanensis]